MYELEIQTVFSAAHSLEMNGAREPIHGHDWRVTVSIEGDTLNDDGLLCDFHPVKGCVESAVERFDTRNLNETPPFDELNPTAELVAKHIHDEVKRSLPESLRITRVRVTESPGCAAVYRPA
jgi:6-pyruvoyltetrahydropterin/6-carboxytetrahydropterin synthase